MTDRERAHILQSTLEELRRTGSCQSNIRLKTCFRKRFEDVKAHIPSARFIELLGRYGTTYIIYLPKARARILRSLEKDMQNFLKRMRQTGDAILKMRGEAPPETETGNQENKSSASAHEKT